MADALIGYTGFVGSNLLRDGRFDALYNSRNIADIKGRHFDRVVCAGVSAVKWWANKNPEQDLAGIRSLMDCLEHVTADRFVLISTIDVYGAPVGVTERDDPPTEGLHAYGLNRLMLERWVAGRFPRHHVVRLPALFGPGLKKNAIYDLINDNGIGVINPESRFQWYPVARLAGDLARIEADGPELINVATEPVSMGAIRDRFFPHRTIGTTPSPFAAYDMRTVHDALLGGSGGYHLHADGVLAALEAYLAAETAP